MKAITPVEFQALLQQTDVKLRLRRELRFVPDKVADWAERELLAVTIRSGNEGVLLIELQSIPFVVPYTITRRLADASGRAKAITCDFCQTWQPGDNAARITFRLSDTRTQSLLCCADLNCSLHVRDLTPAALRSRTQLHEDITAAERIVRLQRKLAIRFRS